MICWDVSQVFHSAPHSWDALASLRLLDYFQSGSNWLEQHVCWLKCSRCLRSCGLVNAAQSKGISSSPAGFEWRKHVLISVFMSSPYHVWTFSSSAGTFAKKDISVLWSLQELLRRLTRNYCRELPTILRCRHRLSHSTRVAAGEALASEVILSFWSWFLFKEFGQISVIGADCVFIAHL